MYILKVEIPSSNMAGSSPANVGIPVVNGHVEAVVTGGLAVGLLVPQVQTVAQTLALVGAGEIHNGGGTAPQSAATAGVEIIGRGGVAHIQIKMGVAVDKAGKQQHSRDICNLLGHIVEVQSHGGHLFAVNEHIGPDRAAAAHHQTAFEQVFHTVRSLLFWLSSLYHVPPQNGTHGLCKNF